MEEALPAVLLQQLQASLVLVASFSYEREGEYLWSKMENTEVIDIDELLGDGPTKEVSF